MGGNLQWRQDSRESERGAQLEQSSPEILWRLNIGQDVRTELQVRCLIAMLVIRVENDLGDSED
jgi:hypothetical protein